MVAGASQNLPGAMDLAADVYLRAPHSLPPASDQQLTSRARHVASDVRLGLGEPELMKRVHNAAASLRDVCSLSCLLVAILDAALSLMEADFGNVQLLNPLTGSLVLVTQSGFRSEFLEYFAVVNDDHSACGRAAKAGVQTVIADVTADPGFAPRCDIAAASGFRSVVSTPLVDYSGRLLGMVSTHFRRPLRPPCADLQVMELFGYLAGQQLAGQLGSADASDLGDSFGQAVLSALLDPGEGDGRGVGILSGLADKREDHAQASPGRASADDDMCDLPADFVHRLFSAGLSLESARSIIGAGPAADRIAAATDELDCIIREIRARAFRHAGGG
jgi:hypothetical protein